MRISEIVGGAPREIRFDPELFDYGKNKLDPHALRGIGFAGFRVHSPSTAPKYKDEVLVFQGASISARWASDQRYGLSARGLAIDTALASGEEFPRFVEFWIERPDAGREGAHDLRAARLEERDAAPTDSCCGPAARR